MELLFSFDDMLITPTYSDTDHNVDISSNLFSLKLNLPVIAAPMDTITESEMIMTMFRAGGYSFHHRYCDIDTIDPQLTGIGGLAVSPSTDVNKLFDLYERSEGHLNVALDVAHGDTERNLRFCRYLVEHGIKVMSGNIATFQAALRYINMGVTTLKIGIGAGSVCSTRVVTGIGVPQATAVYSIHQGLRNLKIRDGITLVSDGGHKNTGDIVKAIVLGADHVMLGSMLAGTSAVPEKGKQEYRGMASANALGSRKDNFFVEGVAKPVEYRGKTSEVLETIGSAIEQACYYTGSENLKQLQNSAWNLITPNAFAEGLPHFR